MCYRTFAFVKCTQRQPKEKKTRSLATFSVYRNSQARCVYMFLDANALQRCLRKRNTCQHSVHSVPTVIFVGVGEILSFVVDSHGVVIAVVVVDVDVMACPCCRFTVAHSQMVVFPITNKDNQNVQ